MMSGQKVGGYAIFIILALVLILFSYFIITELLPRMSISDGTNECVGCAVFGPVSMFVGNTLDARETECRNYWNMAQPFAITDYQAVDKTLTLTLTNKRNDTIVLTQAYVDGLALNIERVQFSPGQSRKITLHLIDGCAKSGDIFDYSIEFTYDNSHVSGMLQMGAHPIFGRCS